jgi:polyhydroxyalkanoate synthesis regulator phasin
MVLDGLRAYIELASGLTEVTRQRATAAARALVAQGEAGVDSVVPGSMRAQVGVLAEELLATSKANRDLLASLVRGEVERSVTRLGLVSAAELEAANRRAQKLDDRVRQLERELRSARKATKTAAAGTGATKQSPPAAQPTKRSLPGTPEPEKSVPGALATKKSGTLKTRATPPAGPASAIAESSAPGAKEK